MDKYSYSTSDFINANKNITYFQNTYDYLIEKWNNNNYTKQFVINFDQSELNIINTIANQRFNNNRLLGRTGGDIEREILGAGGEFAVLKFLKQKGFNIDFARFWQSTDVQINYIDDCDAEIFYNDKNYRLEVKTTTKPINSKLIVPKHQYVSKHHSDIYILTCRVAEDTYFIKGFSKYNNLIFDKTLNKPGYSIHENYLSKNLLDLLN